MAVTALLLLATAQAAVVDRVAVVVGDQVFTETEVEEEVRLTEFLNHQPLDLGPEQRRVAAERLVDQQLIRNEMQVSKFPAPAPGEADSLLRDFRQRNYRLVNQLRAELARYGITEEQLKQHLLWQFTALRFTDLRFGPDVSSAGELSANRLPAGSDPAPGNAGEDRMDAWLKQARSQTHIELKKEAFQ